MRLRQRLVTFLTIAGALAAPITFGACGGYRTYDRTYDRVHDSYHGVYYRWDRAEERRYRRWEVETRRPHVDFGRRPDSERRAYFDWRHRR
jgi:hypothetical protein